ncbi:1-aminocyclopropane-1-carboxylate deaminase [Paraferrimonas haliotis]|uniref:1-aminocyclopropane-1-carboxylate deaminase n=1 Tax=Paraferrimonas haliotis TaxID=2013866 RepID=A0AA37TKP0_9GAMM|nr:1-aminocyclopropane-1-carboxylate deaminase [Paraferrimonas haliotis]
MLNNDCFFELSQPSLLTRITHPALNSHNVSLWLKRDDLIHNWVSGNKYRKLKYHLRHAAQQGNQGIVSFGGAFSNHLHAVAAITKANGLYSVGIIRGEYDPNNPTLLQLQKLGMKLHFVSRQHYRQRHLAEYQQTWQQRYPDALVVPEGGSSQYALPGVAEVVSELRQQLGHFDSLVTAVGSGGTLAGLVYGVQKNRLTPVNCVGYCAIKNGGYLTQNIDDLLTQMNAKTGGYRLQTDYHCKGFAKVSDEQLAFIEDWHQQTNIAIDPIYTSKMLLGLFSDIEQGMYDNQTVVALHTGGLQGWQGMQYRGMAKSGLAIPPFDKLC